MLLMVAVEVSDGGDEKKFNEYLLGVKSDDCMLMVVVKVSDDDDDDDEGVMATISLLKFIREK